MGNRVPRVKTEASTAQMSQAISESWHDLFGEVPSNEQVALVLAQNSLETGNRKSMWNYNIGNITTNGKGQYDYYDDLPTKEQIKPGVWKTMNLKYRSYPSLKAGVSDYLKLLSGKRYSNAWEHIKNPDPVAFSKALKSSGYYTANEAPYTKTLTKLYNQYSKNVPTSQAIPENDNSLNNLLDKYLQMVAASNKTVYKDYLSKNDIVIKISSKEYNSSIEFARILCTALEEELLAKAYTHTDGKNVEIECSISGPEQDCFNTVQQLSNSVSDAFVVATNQIGGIKIKTNSIMDKKSSYKQLDFKTAESQYRIFLLKFI